MDFAEASGVRPPVDPQLIHRAPHPELGACPADRLEVQNPAFDRGRSLMPQTIREDANLQIVSLECIQDLGHPQIKTQKRPPNPGLPHVVLLL